MPSIEYDTVEPLIATTQISGNQAVVVFRCPVTAETVQGTGTIDTGGFWRRAGQTAKQSMLWGVRSSIANRISRAGYGHGLGGMVASQTANQMVYSTQLPGEAYTQRPSNKKVRDGIVDAFRSVADRFSWEDAGRRWVSNSAAHVAPAPFEEQLARFPVVDAFDRDVLLRVLAAIAAGDGTIADEERQFFATMAPTGPALDALVGRTPDAVTLGEVSSPGVRETVLMLAWVVAVSDEELEQSEVALLAQFAAGLRVDPARADVLKAAAQQYVIDSAIARLAASGLRAEDIRAQVDPIARGIGFDPDQAYRLVIRHQRRLGLA